MLERVAKSSMAVFNGNKSAHAFTTAFKLFSFLVSEINLLNLLFVPISLLLSVLLCWLDKIR